MKWAYSIQQKFKAAMLLAIVCIIILITNLVGRHQMDKLSDSFSSMFKDRLVAESYIYMISDHLYQKKSAFDNHSELDQPDFRSKINSHNEAITGLILFYEKTFLTEEEAAFLHDLKTNIAALRDLELQYFQHLVDEIQHTTTRVSLNERFALASANLRQLSQVQIKEGKALNDQSQRIVNGSSLLTKFEMAMLICIAIILQIIVLASRPTISRKWQQGNLN